MIVDYIDEHKVEYGVGTICRVLTERGCKIASSTYYDRTHRQASARAVRDEELTARVSAVHAKNYSVYGARKVWLALNREGTAVARCTVERLMRRLGLTGARRGKVKRTTIADPQGRRADDLVDRHFDPPAPNRLWVADFTSRTSPPDLSKAIDRSHFSCAPVDADPSNTMPCCSSSFESRCRARIKSPRTSSRARTRSRAASCPSEGMTTVGSSPIRTSLAIHSASLLSV